MSTYTGLSHVENGASYPSVPSLPRVRCTLNGRQVSLKRASGAETVHKGSEPDPHLDELVDSLLPVDLHTLDRQNRSMTLPLYLVYIDPNKELSDNIRELTDFAADHSGEQAIWMPVSGNASSMLNVLQKALPTIRGDALKFLCMLYVGDQALRHVMEELAVNSGMGFCFHALY
ncbi:MAG: hypothetical protein VW258_12565 [Thalassolituus sp.]